MAKFCDNCRVLNNNTKTIKRPENFYKFFNKNYIEVCPKCMDENNWQFEPEYQLTQLNQFVNKHRYNAVVPSLVQTDDGREFLTFTNGQGQYMSSKELKFIAESLLETIKLEGIDEALEEFNEVNLMSLNFLSDPDEDEKFLIPFDKLGIRLKKFKPDKRSWSFTCGNCSKKVSSIDGGDYLSIVPDSHISNTTERACSKDCAYVIAKDIILDWINEKQYTKFFNLSKIGERLKDYIAST